MKCVGVSSDILLPPSFGPVIDALAPGLLSIGAMDAVISEPIPGQTKTQAKPSLKERVGKTLMGRFNARRRIGAPFQRVPENLHRTANQLSLGLELIDDFRTGRYREISWGAIALLTGAMLYAISPADVLPDALLGLGALDDAVVLAVATRLLRGPLEAYCEFKGYRWSDYFGSATEKPSEPRATAPVEVEPDDVPA